MKRRSVFLLMAFIGISAFFSCRKEGGFLVKGPHPDSLAYYNKRLEKAKEYLIAGKYDSSICLVKQVLDSTEKTPSSQALFQLKSQAYNILGCNKTVSNRKEAVELLQKACFYAIRGDYSQFLYGVYANLSDVYAQNGDIVNGIHYGRRALYLADSLNLSERNRFHIYYGLGLSYLELRDFKQSDYYIQLAGHLVDSVHSYEKYNYLNLQTNYYYYYKDYQTALSYILKARTVAESSPELIYERNLCNANLADLYLKLGQLDSAEILLSKSLPFFEQSRNLSGVYYIETLQIQLALRQGDLSSAFALLNKPTKDSIMIPGFFVARQQSLQAYYEEVGNYREALHYFKKNVQLDDSIRNERVSNRVAEIDLRYKQDTILLKKTGLIQKQQDEMTRWKLLVVTCAALFLASVMAILYFRKKKDYLQVKYYNRVTELRMENIRNRIFPHFIFNTLMSEIATYDAQDSHRDRLQKLLSLLKQTLQQSDTLALTLREELNFVQSYVDWERVSIDGDFEFAIEVDERTDQDAVCLLAMMVQLPVENAIKHALRGKEGKKKLLVKIYPSERGDTVIRIQDNGPGFGVRQITDAPHTTGTGLRVLTQTIQLLNSKNKEAIYFHISNLTDAGQIIGCQVEIVLPSHYSYQLK